MKRKLPLGVGVAIILIVFALVAYLLPVRQCRKCLGIGQVSILKCGACWGDGRQTLWEIVAYRLDRP